MEMKMKFWDFPVKVVIVIVLSMHGMSEALTGCLDNDNKIVDWFIVYKQPNSAEFFYLDAYKSYKWQQPPNYDLKKEDHAVFNTLRQIYGNKKGNLKYAMYSDQPPLPKKPSSTYGHSKGVIAWAKTGFWLIHSTPRFPPIKEKGYSWPNTAITNGQTFLCISLKESAYESIIVKLLEKTHPYIYYSFGVNEIRPAKGEIVGVYMFSLYDTRFTIYAKPRNDKTDIFEHIASKQRKDISVQTWQRGRGIGVKKKISKVSDVKEIRFGKKTFRSTKDHSKWAVGNTGNVVCIGDLNRMESQLKRGGLFACVHDVDVWRNFNNLIIPPEPVDWGLL